jgi:hypothetical protein
MRPGLTAHHQVKTSQGHTENPKQSTGDAKHSVIWRIPHPQSELVLIQLGGGSPKEFVLISGGGGAGVGMGVVYATEEGDAVRLVDVASGAQMWETRFTANVRFMSLYFYPFFATYSVAPNPSLALYSPAR